MNPEHYTSDAICQAMQLGLFVDPSWNLASSSVLRVVLTPSFHPEVCLTLVSRSDCVLVSVVALNEQLWCHPAEIFRATSREEVKLSNDAFIEFTQLFEIAANSAEPTRRYVCIDGMGLETCLVAAGSSKRLRAHISTLPAVNQFVARLLDVTWAGCRQSRIRNALAQAASYLGLKYPLETVGVEKPRTKLVVLGTPHEQAEYLRAVEKSKRTNA